MIGHLTGIWRDGVVDVNGVGYVVACPDTLTTGSTVALHVHTVWREQGVSLYGFVEPAGKAMFEALCKVNRIGPAAALSVLRTLGAGGCAAAIRDGDVARIAASPGVGKKSAELICTLCSVPDDVQTDSGDSRTSGVVDALCALGYDPSAARAAALAALANTPEGDESTLLRAALETLGGRR
jgi:Holliday junction DNA helicase RuvA